MEDIYALLKNSIIDRFRTSLIEMLNKKDWITIDNCKFGLEEECLIIFKENWKIQFMLYFSNHFKRLCIGITPQFQVDIDIEIEKIIQHKLSKLIYERQLSDKYWIWLRSIKTNNISWSEIYTGKLTNKTIEIIAEIENSLEDVKL